MAQLSTGDRVPNFERPDRDGRLRALYKQDYTRPLVFVCLRRLTQATEELLRALSRPALLWDRAERLLLAPRSCIDSAARHLPFIALQDDGPLLERLAGTGDPAAVVFVLDVNLRVIECMEVGSEPIEALERIEKALAAAPVEPAQTLQQPAPVLMVPRVLDPAFCRKLIDEFEADGGEQSGVSYIENGRTVWKPEPAVKQRRDYYPKDPALSEKIKVLVGQRVLPEIHKAFQFQVTRHEPFKMVCYEAEPGGYFRPHRDNDSRAYAHRRFAMTINLNTGDYRGGTLRFPEYGPHEYAAERGGAIVFSCSLLHEACDVTAGKRYALLGFFFGDDSAPPG